MLQNKLKALAALNKALEESKAWEDAKTERLQALPEWKEIEKIKQEQAEIKDSIDKLKAKIKQGTLEK